MNIHTVARRAAAQMHDDQFDLVTRKAATEFKQDKPFNHCHLGARMMGRLVGDLIVLVVGVALGLLLSYGIR
jgi:hypothetical protein